MSTITYKEMFSALWIVSVNGKKKSEWTMEELAKGSAAYEKARNPDAIVDYMHDSRIEAVIQDA